MVNNEKINSEEKNVTESISILPALSLGTAMTLFFLLEAWLILTLPLFDTFLSLDSTIQNLLVLLITQIIGVVIIFYFFLPFFRIEHSKFHPFSRSSFRTTIVLFFLSLSSTFLVSLFLTSIFAVLGWVMKLGYSEITITAEHISNPSLIILFLVTTTIGAPLFEEMVFRRMLIPLLEDNQVSPFGAVIGSSIMFALVHLYDNLVYGNIAGGIYQTIGVFFLSMMLGMSYIMTRNIIFPVALHAFTNLLGSLSIIFMIVEDYTVLTIHSLLVLFMLVIGIGILLYLLGKYFRGSETGWMLIIKEKSQVRVLHRLTKFYIVGAALVFFPSILKMSFILLKINRSLSDILLIISLASILVTLLWFIDRKGTKSTTQ